MSLIIVTDRCFLKCKDVVSISLQQRTGYDEDTRAASYRNLTWSQVLKNRLNKDVEQPQYSIDIVYIPENSSHGSDEHTFILNLTDKVEAFKLFASMVKEIRDQHPDALYLDDMVKKILNESSAAQE